MQRMMATENRRYRRCWGWLLSALLLAISLIRPVSASWDGDPTLEDIIFSFESFVDINAYQFRPSEEVKWYGVENGFRAVGGSLDHNFLYMYSDLRLKRALTPGVNFRVQWREEEFYESRDLQRPLLEAELRPEGWPLSLSLIGSPEYAKRESDIGLATTLGERSKRYLRLAWLSPDNFYNEKNIQDGSFYRSEPEQWTVEGAWDWQDRYRLRFWWQENRPLEFVPDDQLSLFSYENSSYRASLDYTTAGDYHYGMTVYGFDTRQGLDGPLSRRTQDIRYLSIEGYWFTELSGTDEWTVGLRYDDFENSERATAEPEGSFDFLFQTYQLYSIYHRFYQPQQAWAIGLYIGQATKGDDYVDASFDDTIREKTEAKLTNTLEFHSADRESLLSVTLSWNLDGIASDPVDGGLLRFSGRF